MRKVDRERINRPRKIDTRVNGVDYEALRLAKKADKGKVPLRIDSKTIIMVNKDDPRLCVK